ncbi:MAG: ABC transporter permease, partial [Bryobacteraceae bacterium]
MLIFRAVLRDTARPGPFVFERGAFAGALEVDLSGIGPASVAHGLYVTGGYFSTLGVKTVQGRPLGEQDDTPSAPPAIVLDYGYWKRAFGADPSAAGRTLRNDNTDALVVGVADPQFTGLTPGKVQDFHMPLSLVDRLHTSWWGSAHRLLDPSTVWVTLVARRKPRVPFAEAQNEISSIFRNEVILRGLGKATDAPAVKLLPARAALDGENSQLAPMLNLIMIAAGFVLLIACANVAGLILARSANRQRELAVRHALGARRGRITRQLLTGSVLLSGAGAALGVLAAEWGVEVIAQLISSGSDQPFPFLIKPDWRVLTFTAAVTLATGIFSGLAPAFCSARSDLTPPLRENASTLPGGAQHGHRFHFGDALVVAQVTLSIIILVGAGLLVRTLHNLHSMNPGFSTENVLPFGINPKIAGYNDHQTVQLYRDLRRQFSVLPGVQSASYSEFALLSRSWSGEDVHLDDALPKINVNTATLAVGPDFFSTMQIPMLASHTFSASDFTSAEDTFAAQAAADEAANKARSASGASLSPENAGHRQPQPAPMPVLINQTFARQFFPNENPVGRHMGDGQHDEPATGPQPGFRIVGIVGDTKNRDLRREIGPTMFTPLVGTMAFFELRTAGDPDAVVNAVRGVVSRADKKVPIFGVRTETRQIEQTLFQERLLLRLSSFFALLALALSCLGL